MAEVTVRGRTTDRSMDVSIGGSTFSFDRGSQNIRSVDFLLTALGSCTLATISAYLTRKGLETSDIRIELSAAKADGADHYNRICLAIDCGSGIDEKTRKILREVSKTCTIHKTLHADPDIEVRILL